ncbi:MAG: SPASM domain-containing protein [Anaerolineae bacterium]
MAQDWLKRLLSFERAEPTAPVEPGLYHVMQETDDAFARFHLRVEKDGSGMLIANAMAAARLTASGVVIAKGLLEGRTPDEIVERLRAHFSGAKEEIVRGDIAKVHALIERLRAPGDTYPVFNLEDASLSPYAAELIAPLQATVPLVEPKVIIPILDRLWEVGIPHVTILVPYGCEPTDVLRVVERAEDLGMIAGVRGRATTLAVEGFLPDLRQTGVDHVTFLYAAADQEIHDSLCGEGDFLMAQSVLDWLETYQIAAVAEIPLVQATLDRINATVDVLIANGADNLSFIAYPTTDPQLARAEGIFSREGMAQVAATVEETADMANARFIWDPPVERDPNRSLMDQILQGPRCSGDVAVRIEPTGEVIPPRGPYRSAGNLLRDSWDTIWNDAVFRDYRERVEAPTRCEVCPGLAICAAACPRDPEGWARGG